MKETEGMAKSTASIVKQIEAEAETAGKEAVDTLLHARRVFEWKTRRIPGRKRRLMNQVTLACRMIQDYRSGVYGTVPWRSLSMLAAALIYFINPMDLVPDMIPGLGLVDDALVLGAVFFALRADLLSYCLFKHLEPADYF